MTEERKNLHCQGRGVKQRVCVTLLFPSSVLCLQIAAHTFIFFSLDLCCHFLQIYTIKVILGIKDGLTSEHGNGCTELTKCPSRQGSSFCLLVTFHCEKKNRILHPNTLLIQFLSKFRDIQQRCQHLRKSLWEPHHMEHAFGEICLTYFKHHYQGEMNLALTVVLL